MLTLALLRFLPYTTEQINSFSVDFLPPQTSEFVNSLFHEIYEKSNGTIFSLSTLTAILAASRGILAVIAGLNSIYRVKEKRSFIKLRIVAIEYMVITVAMLIATLTILVFGKSLLRTVTDDFIWYNVITKNILFMRWIVTLFVLVPYFLFFYTVIPERDTRFINELPGAITAAVGWLAFSALFSIYIEKFANYSYLYGSLTSIILLMLWLYFCMNILFIGAEINSCLDNRKPLIKAQVPNKDG
jgi:membrane protein